MLSGEKTGLLQILTNLRGEGSVVGLGRGDLGRYDVYCVIPRKTPLPEEGHYLAINTTVERGWA
ncbi:MAG: hypothetical protein RLZZ568_2114 [Cyanobacteriota bacterium]